MSSVPNQSPPSAPVGSSTETPRVAKSGPAAPRKLKGLHSRSVIDAILRRESARCERNGHEFSLVIIAADSRARHSLYRLARLLGRRARSTDEIGWFDDDRLCVVLPDTKPAGAMAFLRDFTDAAYFRGLSPVSRVFSYPKDLADSEGKLQSVDQAFKTTGKSTEGTGKTKESATDETESKIEDLYPLLMHPLPWWKRAIDIAFAGTALLLAMPVMAIAALAIKLSDPGPVIFKQQRAGLGGRPFTIYKFRTMIIGAEDKQAMLLRFSEQDGPAFKLRHDPRITRVGRILRETSLDEVPQLWNVLWGDMSLVGPRPLPLHESNRCDVWQRRRLDVTPGLTCIWQVKGRSTVSFNQWARMDRRYIFSRSFWNDLKLLLMTIPAVLTRRGAK